MNLFSISGLSCGLACFALVFVTLAHAKTKVQYLMVLFNIAASLWGIGAFIVGQAKDMPVAVFGWRLSHVGAMFIGFGFYHLIVAFCGLKRKWTLRFVYIIGFALLYFDIFTNLYISPDLRLAFNSIYYQTATPAFSFFLFLWVCVVIVSFIELVRFILSAEGIERTRAIYLFFASLMGFSGGTSTLAPVYKIDIIYPFGNFGILIYSLILTYAILRHQLMDIEVVIKKSIVFAGMFTLAFGVFVVISLLVSQFIAGGSNILSFAISAFIITILLRPIETVLINITDKFLFQKKYEYKEVLKKFIDEVIMVLNLDEVVNSTLKLLDQTLHPYTASIFILNKVEDKFQLYNSQGIDDKNLVFNSDSKLITFLKKTRNPAVIKQIDGIVGVSPEIISEMNKLKAVLVLPLMLHNDMIGFISLGKKKSDEDYSKDDLDVLLDLARTESIAVGNAQLLQEAAQAEKRAAIGTMAAGINHEIGNPLNIINTKIQFFLLSNQRGLFKDKTKEEIIQECSSILDETMKQTNRISEITRKLSNFAKPSKEFKPQLISIPDEIEETLAMVGHELELEKIKIEKEIASGLYKILADKGELQQILFNIIRNAAQAIEGTGTITLRALSTTDGKVHIEIQDTGKGIPEDKIHRIFEPFFTTKGPNKGTGLGLSIVRQLVWKNKGEITFRSQEGVGTTFILEFPRG